MFNPTGNRIVVRPENIVKEETTDSGIIITREKQDEHRVVMSGVVQSVGMDVREVKVGYEIFYELHAANTFSIKGNDYVVVQETGILGYDSLSQDIKMQPINETEGDK